jgi:hypothetical protein
MWLIGYMAKLAGMVVSTLECEGRQLQSNTPFPRAQYDPSGM